MPILDLVGAHRELNRQIGNQGDWNEGLEGIDTVEQRSITKIMDIYRVTLTILVVFL